MALRLVYEAGEHGVAVGGALTLIPSPFWGWSAGVTEWVGPDGVDLEVRAGGGMTSARVAGRALAAGERVAVAVGVGQTARVDRFAEDGPALWLGVDGDGDGIRAMVDPVRMSVVAGPPAQLVATLPSAAAPGEEVALTVAVLDASANAFGPFTGDVQLRSLPGLRIDAVHRLNAEDAGIARVLVVPERPGIYVVEVSGPGALRTRSNPMVVRAGVEPILWGDLQIHTGSSDGTGAHEAVWRYAREVAALDVAAVTDHDHWGMRFLDADPSALARANAAVDAAHAPGTFVAVHGYEWTSWLTGHRHVLSFDGAVELHSSLDGATDTPAELRAALRGREAVIVPHHVAGGPIALDWSRGLDPALEPVVEIASVHGQSESPELPGAIYDAVPGTFAFDQLAAGMRFGMIGSTDGHDGHPGLSHLVPGGHGGLVAFPGIAATRADVLAALRSRRVYATNGPRIVLRVTIAGAPMGAALARPEGPVSVVVRVVGTAPIDRVELVGPQGVVGSRSGQGTALLATWQLAAPAFLYMRVVQIDGGLAWSSPVFFDGD